MPTTVRHTRIRGAQPQSQAQRKKRRSDTSSRIQLALRASPSRVEYEPTAPLRLLAPESTDRQALIRAEVCGSFRRRIKLDPWGWELQRISRQARSPEPGERCYRTCAEFVLLHTCRQRKLRWNAAPRLMIESPKGRLASECGRDSPSGAPIEIFYAVVGTEKRFGSCAVSPKELVGEKRFASVGTRRREGVGCHLLRTYAVCVQQAAGSRSCTNVRSALGCILRRGAG